MFSLTKDLSDFRVVQKFSTVQRHDRTILNKKKDLKNNLLYTAGANAADENYLKNI